MEPGPTICIKARHRMCPTKHTFDFAEQVPEGAAGSVIQVPHPKAKGRLTAVGGHGRLLNTESLFATSAVLGIDAPSRRV